MNLLLLRAYLNKDFFRLSGPEPMMGIHLSNK